MVRFTEKEMFYGKLMVVIIVGLLFYLYIYNSPETESVNSNAIKNVNNPKSNNIIKTITGDVVNLVQGEEDYCGDGNCQEGEDCSTCSTDCGACVAVSKCGNGICDSGECSTCSSDCKLVSQLL